VMAELFDTAVAQPVSGVAVTGQVAPEDRKIRLEAVDLCTPVLEATAESMDEDEGRPLARPVPSSVDAVVKVDDVRSRIAAAEGSNARCNGTGHRKGPCRSQEAVGPRRSSQGEADFRSVCSVVCGQQP